MHKILVVEDSPDSRYLLQRALKLRHYDVFEAETGAQALAVLERDGIPDLLITDLTLPNMSGAELIKRIRSTPGLASVKIVIVSGCEDLKARADQLGADGSIRKPFNLSTLYQEVQRCIEQQVAQLPTRNFA